MSIAPNLTYLGVLAAPTEEGPQVVAVATEGAVDLYHLVNPGIDVNHPAVQDWLWTAGINPLELADSLPPDILIRDVLIPQIGTHTLVICLADMEVPFVCDLAAALQKSGKRPIVTGVELKGLIEQAENGAAGRRAHALKVRYESALKLAEREPVIHRINGRVGDAGQLTELSISGIFANYTYPLQDEQQAFWVLASFMNLGNEVRFTIEQGPAYPAIHALVEKHNLQSHFV